jgi:hypothetical protein
MNQLKMQQTDRIRVDTNRSSLIKGEGSTSGGRRSKNLREEIIH